MLASNYVFLNFLFFLKHDFCIFKIYDRLIVYNYRTFQREHKTCIENSFYKKWGFCFEFFFMKKRWIQFSNVSPLSLWCIGLELTQKTNFAKVAALKKLFLTPIISKTMLKEAITLKK